MFKNIALISFALCNFATIQSSFAEYANADLLDKYEKREVLKKIIDKIEIIVDDSWHETDEKLKKAQFTGCQDKQKNFSTMQKIEWLSTIKEKQYIFKILVDKAMYTLYCSEEINAHFFRQIIIAWNELDGLIKNLTSTKKEEVFLNAENLKKIQKFELKIDITFQKPLEKSSMDPAMEKNVPQLQNPVEQVSSPQNQKSARMSIQLRGNHTAALVVGGVALTSLLAYCVFKQVTKQTKPKNN